MVRRPCLEQGCPALAEPGESRCAQHRRKAWAGSSRRGSTRAWRAQRRRVLARDRHRCVRCGAPANTVDHIVGVALTGIEDVDDAGLQTLCRRCHNAKTSAEANQARWHRDEHD